MTVTPLDPLPPGFPPYADQFVVPRFADTAMKNIVEHYLNVGVPLPERRYWTIGATAYDCEQCVLAVQQLFLGTAEIPLDLTQCTGPRSINFTVEVIRCVPTLNNRGQAPPGDTIETASVNPVIDMEILLDLVPYFDVWNAGAVVAVQPIPAQGGYHGAICTYSVTL